MKVNKGESLLMNSDLSHQIQRSVDVHVLLCALKVVSWSKKVYEPAYSISLDIYHISYIIQIFCTCNSRFRTSISPFTTKKSQGDSTFEGFNCFVTCLEVHPYHDGCLRLLILLFLFTKADLRQFTLKFVENPNLNTSNGMYGPWMTMIL